MGLGWLGEPTIEKLLHPLFEKWNLNPSISSVLTFGLAFYDYDVFTRCSRRISSKKRWQFKRLKG